MVAGTLMNARSIRAPRVQSATTNRVHSPVSVRVVPQAILTAEVARNRKLPTFVGPALLAQLENSASRMNSSAAAYASVRGDTLATSKPASAETSTSAWSSGISLLAASTPFVRTCLVATSVSVRLALMGIPSRSAKVRNCIWNDVRLINL